MYTYDKTIRLVTIASASDQNIALLEADEYFNADSLAVIHKGYVNLIPVLNPSHRSKYVSLCQGKNRGQGTITQVKWLRINGEMVFIILSSTGMQVYDAEVRDLKFHHCCKEIGDKISYIIGACLVRNNTLCIGTSTGSVWMFHSNENNTNFNVINRIQVHDAAVSLLGGYNCSLATASKDTMYFWTIVGSEFEISRKIEVQGLISEPTAMKVSSDLVFVGYESGEFCIFDFADKNFVIRSVAHKLKITSIDFSPLKYYVLTASSDGYVKVWNFGENVSEAVCKFALFNEDGPLCGAAFLNFNCSEFCTVTAENVGVKVYAQKC